MIFFLLWQEGAQRGKEAGTSGHRKSHRSCLRISVRPQQRASGAGLSAPASSAWPGPGPSSQALGLHCTTLPRHCPETMPCIAWFCIQLSPAREGQAWLGVPTRGLGHWSPSHFSKRIDPKEVATPSAFNEQNPAGNCLIQSLLKSVERLSKM